MLKIEDVIVNTFSNNVCQLQKKAIVLFRKIKQLELHIFEKQQICSRIFLVTMFYDEIHETLKYPTGHRF